MKITTKQCSVCGKVKLLTEYYRATKRADGFMASCRRCANEYSAFWQRTHKVQANAKSARWRKAHPDQMHDCCRRWRRRHMKEVCQRQKRWYGKHRASVLMRRKQHYQQHPEYYRDQHLRHKYGITYLDLCALFRQQEGRCEICRHKLLRLRRHRYTRSYENRWIAHVDHDHKTKRVRGLLCADCNFAVGMLHDSVIGAEQLVRYLRKHTGAKRCEKQSSQKRKRN